MLEPMVLTSAEEQPLRRVADLIRKDSRPDIIDAQFLIPSDRDAAAPPPKYAQGVAVCAGMPMEAPITSKHWSAIELRQEDWAYEVAKVATAAETTLGEQIGVSRSKHPGKQLRQHLILLAGR